MTPHTSAPQGKRIKVILKDGTTFIDKFLGGKSTKVMFEKHIVNRGQIKSFSIIKGIGDNK